MNQLFVLERKTVKPLKNRTFQVKFFIKMAEIRFLGHTIGYFQTVLASVGLNEED